MILTPPQSPHSSSSPTFAGPAPTTSVAASPRPDKRASVSGASAYPTPPPSTQPYQHAQFNAGRHAQMPSIQGQLEIPPYNPNKKRQAGQQAEPASSSPTQAQAQRRPQAARPASTSAYPTRSAVEESSSTAGAGSRNRASVASSVPAAHAGRQRVYFGPYLLLQTLGEGEFGKVKLGTHMDRPGEEVAIKLIKRGTVQDSQTRMAKVAREIDVLKVVKHPNIVRLHNVIETEKYIGIVLEYASGGELFDHILAHRYLKERDACKLFAQLISGVSYLHGKKIVHRDLKLENLLLDRNRNIIVTDFGFANRYHDKTDDLMSTSCGSPCYAAPELVVQDGKYVGSAVDVWSCGVILYAMLAGYLPFDDDPNNPEGDNINMLYRYIINTPLSFPEWIPAEPRDLLMRMLVPDPLRRCTLEDVARHPWLRRYREVFTKTVEELEAIADAQDRRKAEMIEQRRLAAEQALSGASLARSHSTVVTQRHQSAAIVPTSGTMADLSSPPAANTRSGRRAQVASAIVAPISGLGEFNLVPDLSGASPLGASSVPMATTASAPGRTDAAQQADPMLPPSASTRAAEAKRKKAAQAAHRYTVQVEYDPGTSAYSHSTGSKGKARALESDLPEESSLEAVETLMEDPPLVPLEPSISAEPHLPSPQASQEAAFVDAMAVDPPQTPVSPTSAVVSHESENVEPADPPGAIEHTPQEIEAANAAPLIKAEPTTPEKAKGSPVSASPSAETPRRQSARLASQAFPSPERERERERAIAAEKLSGSPTRTAKSSIASAVPTNSSSETARPDVLAASRSSRHKKGMSTDNRFLNRLLGSSSESIVKTDASAAMSNVNASSTTRPRRSETVQSELSEEAKKKNNRRKALSMMVEPFSASPKRKTRPSDASAIKSPPLAPSAGARSRVSTAAMPPPAPPASRPVASSAAARQPVGTRQSPRKPRAPESQVWMAPPALAGQSKAKRVMDWFRWRSLSRDTAVSENIKPPMAVDAAFEELPSPVLEVAEEKPKVVVTNAAEAEDPQSVPSSRSASGAHSEVSDAPTATTGATSVVSDVPKLASKPMAPSATSLSSASVSISEPYNERQLRFHNGAVDQNALTSRAPPSVVADIRRVLHEMGIDAREEAGPFRLRCQRPTAKKNALTISTTHGSTKSDLPGSASLSGISGLSASPSAAFRAFFNRRNSTTSSPSSSVHGHGSSIPSPALTQSTMTLDSPLIENRVSSLAKSGSTTVLQYPTWVGADDSGGEVRFSVEVARIKGLSNLYSVDLRRLKGSLFEYRAIYLEVLNRLELSS